MILIHRYTLKDSKTSRFAARALARRVGGARQAGGGKSGPERRWQRRFADGQRESREASWRWKKVDLFVISENSRDQSVKQR